MDRELILRITIENAPAGVDFALQKGKGSKYETVQVQRSGEGDLQFEFVVVLRTKAKSVHDFFGPFVQGPPSERFVYIDIGTYAGQKNTDISRRLKIPLYSMDRDTLNHVLLNKNIQLETRVAGTARDGGPNCGTVRPFNGWRPVS
jgi:hypothetical protein